MCFDVESSGRLARQHIPTTANSSATPSTFRNWERKYNYKFQKLIMSRRAPNPAAERAAQNTQTIKSLLKLEGNKTCADCKRNKREINSSIVDNSLLTILPQIQDGRAGI